MVAFSESQQSIQDSEFEQIWKFAKFVFLHAEEKDAKSADCELICLLLHFLGPKVVQKLYDDNIMEMFAQHLLNYERSFGNEENQDQNRDAEQENDERVEQEANEDHNRDEEQLENSEEEYE